MNWLNILVLVGYIAIMIFIALYTRKKTKTVDDFLLAGKKGLNGWMSAFAYGTTYFSAVIFIGYAGKFGWSFGLAAIWIGIGNALIGSLLAWKLMAKRTKNMTQRLSAKTMPEFFEKRYESKGLRVLSACVIFIFLIPYSASVYNGLGNLFQAFFQIDGVWVMLILALLTALYLVFGGYFATSLSDFVQGIIMLLGVAVMVICFLASSPINLESGTVVTDGFKRLSEMDFGLFIGYGDKGFFNSPAVTLVSLILLTSMGVYGLPQTIHKYYAVRDKRAIKQGMIVSTLFALVVGVSAYLIGGLSRLFFSELPVGGTDNLVPEMLLSVIPKGFMGLVAVLVLSASMSTLASVSLSSASVVSVDLYKGAIRKDASEKKVTLLMRIMCLVFVLISVVIALLNMKFKITAIAYLMSLSWGTLSGCFFGPFVVGLYDKKLTKTAAYVSIIGSIVLTATLTIIFGAVNATASGLGAILKSGVTYSPITGVLCMFFSIIATPIVSRFTKKPSQEAITEAFDKEIDNLVK